jgi:hypothetical protein
MCAIGPKQRWAVAQEGDFLMPVEQRDAWVRAYLEDVFNGHNLQSLDKYMGENLVPP